MPWNPEQYHKFQATRSAPFEDIMALITVREKMRVVDLGCGTGELTARLADKLPNSHVLGVDNSHEMLQRAQQHKRHGLDFEWGDIGDASASPFSEWDLIFSHAALHWIPDHKSLIPRLLTKVAPGGQLAVQIPSNYNHIAQSLVVDIALEEPFRSALNGFVRYSPVLPIDDYAQMLFDGGCENIVVFEKIYPQVHENSDGVVEFTKGSVLVPYLERLGDLGETFMQTYRQRLRQHLPASPQFYSFRRIIFVGTKSH
ncbi:MAG: methyltransferase domain-containing protein [Anaerolineae bacterium]